MMNYLQSGTNMLPAIASILVGISAIVFNKYPASKRSLKKMKKKYGYTDRNKLAQADGMGYLMIGVLWICSDIIRVNHSKNLQTIIVVFLIIVITSYFWLRDRFLNKN